MNPRPRPPLMEIPLRIRQLQAPRRWWVVAAEAVLAVVAILGFVLIALSLVWRLIP